MYGDDDELRVPLKADINSVILNPWDRAMGKVLKATVDKLPETAGEKDLLSDCFFGMYKNNPKPTEEVAPERAVNHALMSWCLEGMKERSTVGNIPASVGSRYIVPWIY